MRSELHHMTHVESHYDARLPEGGCVRISVAGDTVRAVEPIPDDNALPWALPVLVDLQQNGGLGTYYTVVDENGLDPLPKILQHLRRHGVGRVLLTVATYDVERLRRSLRMLAGYLDADPGAERTFFAIFHEGVFISPQDGWRGSHVKDWIVPPDCETFLPLQEAAGGRIRVVNVAPEEPGGLDFIERAIGDGITVTIGHCCPSAELVREAAARGASMVTHFGNGAAPMMHRFNNPFWAMLDEPRLKLGLICDGHHLPPEMVSVALRCKGRENCYPVSDASGASGLPAGPYENYGERSFVIEEDGKIHLLDSELMMGAWFQQDRCVEFLVEKVGLSFLDAWRQCSEMPAGLAGIELPSLAAGQEASFVLARWRDGLVIEQAVHFGVPYLQWPVRPGSPAEVAVQPS